MFIERRVNDSTGSVELWYCRWVTRPGEKPHKEFIKKVGDEQSVSSALDGASEKVAAICWSWGRTLGSMTVESASIVGQFPADAGSDAILSCSFVNAGKFRRGPDRWWCQTHQSYWGTKGDLASLSNTNVMRCANHAQRLNYVVNPPAVNLTQFAEVGLWCSLPAAVSSSVVKPQKPSLRLHLRKEPEGDKVDCVVAALSIAYNPSFDLFGNKSITQVNVTPPAAFEFVRGMETGRTVTCINCHYCGHPHLDLGDFANKPHRKHTCGHCGRDSTVSSAPVVSTPLQPLHQLFSKATKYVIPDRALNLDDYVGCTYAIWGSTRAIVWTGSSPLEFGFHVQVHRGSDRIVDDVFGEVYVNGRALDRYALVQEMFARTLT